MGWRISFFGQGEPGQQLLVHSCLACMVVNIGGAWKIRAAAYHQSSTARAAAKVAAGLLVFVVRLNYYGRGSREPGHHPGSYPE